MTHLFPSEKSRQRIPTGFRLLAQGCEERATLGKITICDLKAGPGATWEDPGRNPGDITVCDILDSYPLMHHQPQPESL